MIAIVLSLLLNLFDLSVLPSFVFPTEWPSCSKTAIFLSPSTSTRFVFTDGVMPRGQTVKAYLPKPTYKSLPKPPISSLGCQTLLTQPYSYLQTSCNEWSLILTSCDIPNLDSKPSPHVTYSLAENDGYPWTNSCAALTWRNDPQLSHNVPNVYSLWMMISEQPFPPFCAICFSKAILYSGHAKMPQEKNFPMKRRSKELEITIGVHWGTSKV